MTWTPRSARHGVMRPYAMHPNQPVVQGLAWRWRTRRKGAGRPRHGGLQRCPLDYLDACIPTGRFVVWQRERTPAQNEWVDINGYIANVKAYALASSAAAGVAVKSCSPGRRDALRWCGTMFGA